MKWEFKENHTFGKCEENSDDKQFVLCLLTLYILCHLHTHTHTEVRCAESAKIRAKYQDRIPVRDGEVRKMRDYVLLC